jgi:hypothetical protein
MATTDGMACPASFSAVAVISELPLLCGQGRILCEHSISDHHQLFFTTSDVIHPIDVVVALMNESLQR